jgi:hypothetical protein
MPPAANPTPFPAAPTILQGYSHLSNEFLGTAARRLDSDFKLPNLKCKRRVVRSKNGVYRHKGATDRLLNSPPFSYTLLILLASPTGFEPVLSP